MPADAPTAVPSASSARGAVPAALVIAVSLALGLCGAAALQGMHRDAAAAIAWTSAALACVLGFLSCIPRSGSARWPSLCAAAFCAGAALGVGQLRAGFGSNVSSGPVRLLGTVASAPRETGGGSDVLARFAHGSAGEVFELEVHAVECADGSRTPVSAAVFVRVQELGPLPPRGSAVRVTGWYSAPGRSMNPGGRAPSGDGGVTVPSLALIQSLSPSGPGPMQRARLAADAALDASFPSWAYEEWRALVKAMTTGVRMPALVVPGAQFRMAGMSHVLAISGFNVAVLVSAGAAVAALLGGGVACRALVALATSALFLTITEPEVSVLRAGLGAGLAGIVGIRGGRARGLGALGAVATASLILDPSCLFNAGFQLSYGVVLGLLTLAGPPAERWGERAVAALPWLAPQRIARSETAHIVTRMFVGACISSVVAFTVSTPIALCHGGFMSTYAAPISVITMPAAALVTMGGVAAIALGSFWHAAASLAGALACGCAAFLAWVADCAAELPGTCWWTGRPALWWVALAAAAVAVAWCARAPIARRTAWVAVLTLAALAWLGAARPFAERPDQGFLSVHMLDVGNGSCILVRTRDSALLYDAGTSSDDSAGSRRIVPALAALGVRTIDTLIISHASMEHFSAVPEVVRAFDVRRVVAPESAAEALRGGRENSSGLLAQWLDERGRSIEFRFAGEDLRVGQLHVQVLAPCEGMAPKRPGDGSLVVRVSHALADTPRAAVLLTGGLREEGCRALPAAIEPCAAMELPAHGAFTAGALRLVQAVQPQVLLQSAGASRTRNDRWAGALAERTGAPLLGITFRHGALRVLIGPDGTAQTHAWSGGGWVALQDERALKSHDIAHP